MTDHDPNRDLDAWLHSIDDVQPSAQLQRAIAEIPVRHPRATELRWPWPLSSLWQRALAAALAGVLGVIAGTYTVDTQAAADEATVVADDEIDLAFALPLDEETSR